MSFLQLDNASLYYEVKGQGHPLILLSGFTCDHMVWLPVVDQLAKRYQVILLDNRGAGQTQDRGEPLSAELLASDVKHLIQALHLKKAHIIGSSMGGTIALKFAALYPEHVSKLGLLVTTAKWRAPMLAAIKSLLLLELHGVSDDLVTECAIPWLFGGKFLNSPSRLKEFKELAAKAPYPQSLQNQERQIAILENFDGVNDLKKIVAPTLVIHGKEDLLSLPSESEFLAQNIPNATLKTFDCGHMVVLEAPEALLAAISDFFGS